MPTLYPNRHFAITPNNDNNILVVGAAVLVFFTGSGPVNVVVALTNNTDEEKLTYPISASGTYILGVRKVFATGTTAGLTLIGLTEAGRP